MSTARIRFALVSLVVSLVIGGLGLVAVSAQSTEDSPAFVDPMDGSSPALLSEQSLDAGQVVQQYALGAFIVQTLDPAHSGDIVSLINTESLTDSRTAVDAVIDLSDGGDPSVFVGCRAGEDHNGYAFRLQPASGDVSLWRLDADGPVELESGDASALINAADESNRIELACSGDSISGTLNGEVAISTSDSTVASGLSFIGAGTAPETPGRLFASFDNLEVIDLAGAPAEEEPAEATPVEEEAISTPEATEEEAATAEATEEEAATAEATEEEAATAEATEEEAATAEATEEEAATAALDPGALEAAVIDYAITIGPAAGPFVEDVTLTNGALQVLPAGVQVSNFHAEVRFVVPDAPPGSWSIGFCFWVDPAGNCYDVYVRTNGTTTEWVYSRTEASGTSEVLESGPLAGLDLTPGASNFIGLSIVGETGNIIVNSAEPAATFAVQGPPATGDVTRWLSFTAADAADTSSFVVSTDEFSVWDLSGMPDVAAAPVETTEPAATPLSEESTEAEATETPEATTEATEAAETPESTETTATTSGTTSFDITLGEELAASDPGTLTESETDIDISAAGIDVADFYASAIFSVPDDLSAPWDVTFGFRDIGGNDQYRLTITSDGEWTLSYAGEEPLDSGDVDNLLVAPGEENTVELYTDGDDGAVAVNGVEAGTLDLSEVTDSGDVWIATAATNDTTVVGRTTEFRDFKVYALA